VPFQRQMHGCFRLACAEMQVIEGHLEQWSILPREGA